MDECCFSYDDAFINYENHVKVNALGLKRNKIHNIGEKNEYDTYQIFLVVCLIQN